jgi:hypothetical protein
MSRTRGGSAERRKGGRGFRLIADTPAGASGIAALRNAAAEDLTRGFGKGPWSSRCGFREVGRRSYRGNPLVYFETPVPG